MAPDPRFHSMRLVIAHPGQTHHWLYCTHCGWADTFRATIKSPDQMIRDLWLHHAERNAS